MTITIQIGNSDNRLTQQRWADFVAAVSDRLESYVEGRLAEIHFFGAPHTWAQWQNAAWVVQLDSECLTSFRTELAYIARKFDQDSIALTVGITEFVKA
jgi:hypothetical protein